MIVNTAAEFLYQIEIGNYSADSPACASAVMMIEPLDFTVSRESAIDNHYMKPSGVTDSRRALAQSKALAILLQDQGIEVVSFPGRRDTPGGFRCARYRTG